MRFFFLLLLSSQVFAEDKIFKIKTMNVIVSQQDGIIANRDCLLHKEKCQAYQSAKKFANSKARNTSHKNPHSVKCTQILKGEVVIGIDSEGQENSFCLFPDHSIISCSSLDKIK